MTPYYEQSGVRTAGTAGYANDYVSIRFIRLVKV
jgi:hypothetical protein